MASSLFHLLKTRYTQLGGLRLVREYARMGLPLKEIREAMGELVK